MLEEEKGGEEACVQDTFQDTFQDTVGAVCVDVDAWEVASGYRGGIALKHAGRVGEAAVLGAGCWADARQDTCERSSHLRSPCPVTF